MRIKADKQLTMTKPRLIRRDLLSTAGVLAVAIVLEPAALGVELGAWKAEIAKKEQAIGGTEELRRAFFHLAQ